MLTAMLALAATAALPAEIEVTEKTELMLMTRTILGVERQVVQTIHTRIESVPGNKEFTGPLRMITASEDGYTVYVSTGEKITIYTFEGDGKPHVQVITDEQAKNAFSTEAMQNFASLVEKKEQRWLDDYKQINGVLCRLRYERTQFREGSIAGLEIEGFQSESLNWVEYKDEKEGETLESSTYTLVDGARTLSGYRRTIETSKSKATTPKGWPNITDDKFCRAVTSKKAS